MANKIKVGISSASVIGVFRFQFLFLDFVLNYLKLDRLELVLFLPVQKRLQKYLNRYRTKNYKVTFHQPWDMDGLDEILRKLRILPAKDWDIRELITKIKKSGSNKPMVVHSKHMQTLLDMGLAREVIFEPKPDEGAPTLEETLALVKKHQLKIVFDIGYIHGFPEGKDVIPWWKKFKSNTVKIHLYDTKPGSGFMHQLIFKNMLPGMGVLPINDFFKELKSWKGTVILEIGPAFIFRLKKIKKIIARLRKIP